MKRRQFVKAGAALAAAASLPRFSFAQVKGGDRIKVGLIGCGGRGTGALKNMIEADQNVQVVALADLFPEKLDWAANDVRGFCQERYSDQADDIIKPDTVKKFGGWDCVDQLLAEDVDVVIEATPPPFRTPHYEKIVKAGKHAFLEKPACIDVTQAKKMLELADEAKKKGLCVVCGTQRRYHPYYQELIKRIQDGELGEILSQQCYWNMGGYIGQWVNFPDLDPESIEYQIRAWWCFIWASGDHIVEQHVHNIDVCMWALGDNRFPVEVRGMGGRSTDLPWPRFGDRFSHFAIDYDMGNGLRMSSYCQQDPGVNDEVGERMVGTKGMCYSTLGGKGALWISDLKGKRLWESQDIPVSELVLEHKYLLDAIRNGENVNTLKTLVNSTLVAIAGRMSTFTGKKFKYDWVLARSKEDLMPKNLDFAAKNPTHVPVPGKEQLV